MNDIAESKENARSLYTSFISDIKRQVYVWYNIVKESDGVQYFSENESRLVCPLCGKRMFKGKYTLYVFESPIDAMSHASLAAYILENKDAWKQHSRISLGGCTDLALEQYLSDHPDVKTIVFCLDNDEAGRSATDKFLKKYGEQGFTVRSRPPKEKDYNDDLKSYLVGELKEKLALEKDKKQNKMLR